MQAFVRKYRKQPSLPTVSKRLFFNRVYSLEEMKRPIENWRPIAYT
jgi:hypothetical protein